ncbi:MAG TPA: hypothetical protein VIV40_33400 [Kofleriaceae bacterium]
MTELSRSLLAAAREGLSPDAAVAARVRAKVAASVGAAAATGSAAAIPLKVGSSAGLLKLGAALLALGVVATVIVALGPERAPEAPRLSVTPSETDDVRADVRVVAPIDPGLALPAAPQPHVKHVTPAVELPRDEAAPAAAVAAQEPATLSREVELIDLAMVSLRKHAPLAAIEAIRVFDRETLGQGQMAEEAAAIAIEAHCVLHDDVTDAIARFDHEWPESAQRERIQTTCFARR